MNPRLDIENAAALRDYLHQAGHLGPTGEITVATLAGGVSCRTVRADLPDGRSWVFKQALGKLRVPGDWFSEPARIHREAAGLRWLKQLAPEESIVDFVCEDFEAHLLGMTAVPTPHENWKRLLLTRGPESDHATQFGRLLGIIHRRAAAHAAELAVEFSDLTYFEQLRLDAYYRAAADRVPAAAEFLRRLVADTLAHRETLVHGDYSPKNVLVRGGRLVLLDHEVIHWGDPAFDLGFALTHLLAKARHLPPFRADFTRAAGGFWTAYQAETKELFPGLERRTIRHALGCLLARVDGRSPLEYLSARERTELRAAVLRHMPDPPSTVPALIAAISLVAQ